MQAQSSTSSLNSCCGKNLHQQQQLRWHSKLNVSSKKMAPSHRSLNALVAQTKNWPIGAHKCNNYIRQKWHLAGRVSTNKCAGIVGCSFYIFQPNPSISSKLRFLDCATVAFRERHNLKTKWAKRVQNESLQGINLTKHERKAQEEFENNLCVIYATVTFVCMCLDTCHATEARLLCVCGPECQTAWFNP